MRRTKVKRDAFLSEAARTRAHARTHAEVALNTGARPDKHTY